MPDAKPDLSGLPEWVRTSAPNLETVNCNRAVLYGEYARLRAYAAEQQALKEEAIWAGAGRLRALNIAEARVTELEVALNDEEMAVEVAHDYRESEYGATCEDRERAIDAYRDALRERLGIKGT